jgi:hypothetical protein
MNELERDIERNAENLLKGKKHFNKAQKPTPKKKKKQTPILQES